MISYRLRDQLAVARPEYLLMKARIVTCRFHPHRIVWAHEEAIPGILISGSYGVLPAGARDS